MKLRLRITIGLVICLFFQGCDFVYRLLDKEGAEEKELIGEVVPFQENFAVQEMQTLLELYGYNPGKADGIMGLRTRNAIERFQRDNNLEQSRFADKKTWEKLAVFRKNNLIEGNELNIRLIQGALKNAGFNPGKIDGKPGPQTKKAILEFQKAFDLKVDGKIGYKTLTKLAEFLPAAEAVPLEEL